MSTTTTTGTLAAGSSKTFTLAPGAAVSLILSPNPRVTITETPESVSGSGVGGNTTRVHEPQLPGTFAYGPYAMGGVVVVAVASNSGSSVAWTRKDTVVTTSSDGTSLVSGDGTVISGVGSYTFATLPAAAANPGILAFVSDVGGGTYWRSNGTRWKPQNNRIILDSLGADVTTTGTTEVILKQITFPAGMLKDYDRFFQWITLSKSSTSETATFRWRFGPLGTIADPVLAPSAGATSNNTAIATTNDSCGLLMEWKRKSATTLKLTGSGASNSKWNGPSTGDTTPATTVTDMDANTNYLSFTCVMSAAVEVLTLEDMVTELRGHTA